MQGGQGMIWSIDQPKPREDPSMSATLHAKPAPPAWTEIPPLERVRAIAPILRAESDAIEAGRRLTPTVLDAIHGQGLYRCLVPREYGGDEANPADAVQVFEEMARHDASTAWCVGQASICAMSAAYVKPAVAQEIWGRDPRGALAWGYAQGARARVVDGGYRVTGQWGFGSGGHHATWLGGHCLVEERDGTLRVDADGQPIERTMLFRQDQVSWQENWDVIGLRGTGSDTYRVQDLFVPSDHTVRRDVDAERVHPGQLYQFSTTNLYAACFAGVMMGIARRQLESFKALARAKVPSATTALMRESPVTQLFVAQNEAGLNQARAWLLQVLRDAWAHVERHGRLDLDQKVTIRLAATSAIHRAREVAEACYREAGTTAIFESNPFERPCRDMHAAGQQVQARTAHLEAAGAHLLGLPVNPRFI
jgi:alkylation response protein AidB-like acyl-CoA dehydrogenase